jgi:TonB family protein
MEYRKPEEKKEARREERIRDVANPDRARNVSPMEFKFTPDLSVEGTGGVAMEQDELAAVVFEEGETDEPAVPLYQPPIPYPDRARDLEIEGTLEVILIIDTQGKVGSIEVVRSPHVSITNAARKVIATWRFKPARNKGVPVRMRVRQVIEFALE